MIKLLLKSIAVPKIKLSKLLQIRVAIPYPGFVRTASIKQDDQSFISRYIDLFDSECYLYALTFLTPDIDK